MTPTATILLLGSGELGREFTISAKRLGCHVVVANGDTDKARAAAVAAAEMIIISYGPTT